MAWLAIGETDWQPNSEVAWPAIGETGWQRSGLAGYWVLVFRSAPIAFAFLPWRKRCSSCHYLAVYVAHSDLDIVSKHWDRNRKKFYHFKIGWLLGTKLLSLCLINRHLSSILCRRLQWNGYFSFWHRPQDDLCTGWPAEGASAWRALYPIMFGVCDCGFVDARRVSSHITKDDEMWWVNLRNHISSLFEHQDKIRILYKRYPFQCSSNI